MRCMHAVSVCEDNAHTSQESGSPMGLAHASGSKRHTSRTKRPAPCSRFRPKSRKRSRRSPSGSRSQCHSRSRSRSRARESPAGPAPLPPYLFSTTRSGAMNGGLPMPPMAPPGADMAALAALQQQQQQQQELQRQQMLQVLQQQALASIPGVTIGGVSAPAAAVPAATAATVTPGGTVIPSAATRKGREVYVGNLAVGVMTVDLIRELFNSVLANFVPDPITNPPVVEVKLDSTGRFCFLEMRTLELAAHAMELDKMEVCGRPLKIGRPKGYEEEAQKLLSQQKLSMAQTFAAQLSGGPTNVVLLENLVPAKAVIEPSERREIYDDVFAEAVKCGPVAGVAVPVPSSDIPDDEPCRVYVKYHNVDDAKKCKDMMDGRAFDDRTVKAGFSNEFDFMRAQQGEWITAAPAIQQVSLPGPPPGAAPAAAPPVVVPQVLPPGLAGLAAGLPPGVTIPGVNIPGVTIPGVTIPGVTIPGLAGVTIPGITMPPGLGVLPPPPMPGM